MKKIIIATNNKGKRKEIEEILNGFKFLTLKDINCEIEVEENEETFEGNSLKKAKEISKITNMPALSDDSGLCVDILNGWPGVHTARFLGKEATAEERNQAIIDKLEGKEGKERKARVVCVVTYVDKEEIIQTKGEIVGKIAKAPRGENGFGFDSIFELENGKTLAELSKEEKNEISSRKIALENLKKQLTKN